MNRAARRRLRCVCHPRKKSIVKKLNEQVVVITGASSGIGLATARMMAEKGAKVVLAARSENALRELTDEINQSGKGQAAYVVADVSSEADVARIAQTAQAAFDGFDTWINNAGVGMYGKVEDIPVDDMKKLYETNVWGLVYGSKEAVKHFKNVGGGTLINIGSTVSEAVIPLQGVYSSTKHAVKALTDALRMELEAEHANIVVTLIKPAAIDTPFPMNAKNYLDSEPKHVPPVYDPKTVADAICHCAENPTRDIFVGSGGKGNASMGYHVPRLADKFGEKFVIPNTPSGKPKLPSNALDAPSERLSERGDYPGFVRPISLYTNGRLHPVLTGALLIGAGALLAAAVAKPVKSAADGNRK